MGKKSNILALVGNNIRKKRLELDLSQNQLAFEAGVTREFVNKVESGKYNISVKTLEKLSEILDVDLPELFSK